MVKMAKYVDGFVLVVPKGKAEEYTKMAEMDETYDEHSDFASPFKMSQMAYGGFEVEVEN